MLHGSKAGKSPSENEVGIRTMLAQGWKDAKIQGCKDVANAVRQLPNEQNRPEIL